ncbi:MAG: IclR family transcriptional regulator [Austwickia sp.]|jgi:IclR family acetate operon transcriptional repressor|nr:MAG: IclR family transcriptional regulator [Austwickia sp.]
MLLFDALYRAEQALPLAELARRAGLPKTSTHRLAEELCRHALLERADGGYRLGMRLFELGAGVPPQRALREAALPLMADLREATRCTVHLAVLDGIEVVYVQILNSPGSTRLPSRLGGRLPAHATGVGKVILAYSPAEVVTARIDAGLTRLTPRTICTPGTLSRELETIRANGVAYDREESTVGIHCVAAPVFDAQDRVVAALSVTGRSTREVVRVAPAARTVGLALGRLLQARTPPPAHPLDAQ